MDRYRRGWVKISLFWFCASRETCKSFIRKESGRIIMAHVGTKWLSDVVLGLWLQGSQVWTLITAITWFWFLIFICEALCSSLVLCPLSCPLFPFFPFSSMIFVSFHHPFPFSLAFCFLSHHLTVSFPITSLFPSLLVYFSLHVTLLLLLFSSPSPSCSLSSSKYFPYLPSPSSLITHLFPHDSPISLSPHSPGRCAEAGSGSLGVWCTPHDSCYTCHRSAGALHPLYLIYPSCRDSPVPVSEKCQHLSFTSFYTSFTFYTFTF